MDTRPQIAVLSVPFYQHLGPLSHGLLGNDTSATSPPTPHARSRVGHGSQVSGRRSVGAVLPGRRRCPQVSEDAFIRLPLSHRSHSDSLVKLTTIFCYWTPATWSRSGHLLFNFSNTGLYTTTARMTLNLRSHCYPLLLLLCVTPLSASPGGLNLLNRRRQYLTCGSACHVTRACAQAPACAHR